MCIVIRSIKPEDYEDIYILNSQLGYSYDIEKLRNRIDYVLINTKDVIYVAEHDGRAVGYVHGSPYETLYYDSLINIMGLVVKQGKRRLGIGEMLMNAMEAYAKANGYKGIRLVSGIERSDAHKFYENIGYLDRKTQKNFIKLFEDDKH